MTREQKLTNLALEELNKIKDEAQSKAASDEDFDPSYLAITLGRMCGILDGLNEQLKKLATEAKQDIIDTNVDAVLVDK